jgi:hypothetical protein
VLEATAGRRFCGVLDACPAPRLSTGVSVKGIQTALWAGLSPILCALVGVSYRHFNEQYVVKWWVHCKHCVVGEPPGFDANDFTLIFFASLCLLATGLSFFLLKQRRWPLALGMLAVNASICFYFASRNIWL